MFGSIALTFQSDESDSDSSGIEEDTRLSRRNIRDGTNVMDVPEHR